MRHDDYDPRGRSTAEPVPAAAAPQVSAMVTEWLTFVNPQGFVGNACFDGGCGRPFDKDGCGGMNEAHFVT